MRLLWLGVLTVGAFKLGGLAVTSWRMRGDCHEQIIDRFSNVEGEGCGDPMATRAWPSEELVAYVSVTQCRSRPGISHTRVTVTKGLGNEVPRQAVWRADAGDHPELLHEACGVEVLSVKARWIGKRHLQLGYDRRAHVSLEEVGPSAFGSTIAPYWFASAPNKERSTPP